MKQILLAYLFVGLISVALLSLLSYGYGFGYVYLYWREYQLQTNLWVLLVLIFLLSFTMQMLWYSAKRYLSREQRKSETVISFNNLHPYEQLAVVWLLNAAQDQRDFIQQSFKESGLLKDVIHARLKVGHQDFNQALDLLNSSNPMAFELAEIQRIEIYLAQQEGEKALTHLEFINQHELSPWLYQVKTAYEQRVTTLWGVFAEQYPWLYLRSTKYGHLDHQVKINWLQQILINFDQASSEDLEYLKQRYLDLGDQVFERDYSVKILWLKLLFRMPEMSVEHEQLAVHLLEQQFNADVFYLWFQQQLLKQMPEYEKVEQQITKWENKYPALPILTFAKWHIYQATGRIQEAEQLLALYPDDVRMSYLRVKSALQGNDALVQELNRVFESNINFLNIKI
ncbi:hypothetical protein A3K93_00730 [Acinetobacter sp. NCu2D-2]|uniref:hypothetical protein n=1 Tax=Acinetobacter sp. NCu2D-2 TaxID=1608473 RepID=UPI0007CDCE72|nr:hypothetical protein [Acinetobacter sp. NCu2D-2]ANF80857.1 hypothetical protein A3K93_00730 [Acinetobacter sp. NCu2D-2]